MSNPQIGYDRDKSTELTPSYFVYEHEIIIYRGSYSQCLCVVGAISLDPTITLKEINNKTNGYLFDKV